MDGAVWRAWRPARFAHLARASLRSRLSSDWRTPCSPAHRRVGQRSPAPRQTLGARAGARPRPAKGAQSLVAGVGSRSGRTIRSPWQAVSGKFTRVVPLVRGSLTRSARVLSQVCWFPTGICDQRRSARSAEPGTTRQGLAALQLTGELNASCVIVVWSFLPARPRKVPPMNPEAWQAAFDLLTRISWPKPDPAAPWIWMSAPAKFLALHFGVEAAAPAPDAGTT